jgi:hypothetical protein
MVAERKPKNQKERNRHPHRRQEKNSHLDGAHYLRQIEADDRPTKITGAASTDRSVDLAWKSWECFSEFIGRPDALELLNNVTMQIIRGFMHWYLDKHNVVKADSFWVKMRFWRMAVARKLLKELDWVLRQDMKAVSSQVTLPYFSDRSNYLVYQRNPHPRLRP